MRFPPLPSPLMARVLDALADGRRRKHPAALVERVRDGDEGGREAERVHRETGTES